MRLHVVTNIITRVVIVATGLLTPLQVSAQARLNIYVLEYGSSTGGVGSETENVSRVLQDRMNLLAAQVSHRVRTANYLARLHVVRQPHMPAPDIASMRVRWRQMADALMYVSGSIDRQSSEPVAMSTIYIGDLAAAPLDNLELAKLHLRAAEHQALKDSHSYVATYALLLDARRARAPKATVGAILAQLKSIYTQLRLSPYRLPELNAIWQSAEKIAQAEGLAQ